jgi:uncharacterized membrane protein YtjA (UPF0391 family)
MLNLVITLLVIALIAGILGFGGIAGTAVGVAKIFFFVALVLFVLSLILKAFEAALGVACKRASPIRGASYLTDPR